MNESKISLTTSGAIAWWEPRITDAAKLSEQLERINLERFAPSPRSAEEALKMALRDHGAALEKEARSQGGQTKHCFQVEAKLNRSEDGFELVDKARRRGPNGYQAVVTAKVSSEFVVITDGTANCMDLQEAYNRYRKEVSGGMVGRSLVLLIKEFHGTCCRQMGGVYYLPEGFVDEWHDVVAAYESAGGTEIACVRVALDKDAIKVVRKAIVEELTTEATEVVVDLLENEMKPSALERRRRKAQALRERAKEYEVILNGTLDEVHQILDKADTGEAAATAIKEEDEVFDNLFSA